MAQSWIDEQVEKYSAPSEDCDLAIQNMGLRIIQLEQQRDRFERQSQCLADSLSNANKRAHDLEKQRNALQANCDEAIDLLEVVRHWFGPTGGPDPFKAQKHPLWPDNNQSDGRASKKPLWNRIDEIVNARGSI
jgi:hypothetical protein